ncbi:MAG: kinesin-like nuclear fusion protein [Caeruleum heppii]|nr:MAG: kinesin-like nuclear fusion protein [Caeruleum heppii]
MDNNENTTFMHSSHLRQPSKIPSPGKGLFEMSASANNARATSMMPPPEPISLKHKGSARGSALSGPDNISHSHPVPEPAPKRKTLAERAGETARINAAAPRSNRPVSASVKATTLAGVRNPSFSSSVSSRTPSTSTRDTSTSSFSSSIGPGSRPPSALSTHRPQTSMNHARKNTQPSMPAPRPTSSLESHDGADDRPLGKRKGMPLSSLSSSYTISYSPHNGMSRQAGYGYDDHVHNAGTWLSRGASSADRSALTESLRDYSLTSLDRQMSKLKLSSAQVPRAEGISTPNRSPSHIPKRLNPHISPLPIPITPSSSRSPKRTRSASPKKIDFLTRDSNTQAWDTKGRLEDMEYLYSELKERMSGAAVERNGLEETVGVYKSRSASFPQIRSAIRELLGSKEGHSPRSPFWRRLSSLLVCAVNELEAMRAQLGSSNSVLQTELDTTRFRLTTTSTTLDEERRRHGFDVDDLKRQHRNEIETTKQQIRDELDRLTKAHRDEVDEMERRLKREVEDERCRRVREARETSAQNVLDRQKSQTQIEEKDQEIRRLEGEVERQTAHVGREEGLNQNLQDKLAEVSSNSLTLESSMRALRARIDFLESDSKAQSQSFADLEQKLQDALASATEAKEKLRKEESLRRKLHNQVQELKGNIRVFCRVRPALNNEPTDEGAKIAFPDIEKEAKEVDILGPEEKSSLGTVSTKKNQFAFDRVFGPGSQNAEVFDEISQLVQSALDGYNVCIFCYGQTGSGKTYTMSAADGMIPRAVHQIYDTATSLEEKGWTYTMEGSFVEVYNENLNDLLGRPEEFDKKRHEIRHDMVKCRTTVSDVTTVVLDSPGKVESILKRATANRSIAATKANERSSRSHSVFILRLLGENRTTGERSEGTLNLVDLAGSERLSQSGSTGDRLRETQNINRSLSCLGDVIGALGQGKEGGHVPYRNSKVCVHNPPTLPIEKRRGGKMMKTDTPLQLTYLLQFSLGGNSKTLMFVMISPLQAHLSETLTSLKFATKVHNTHIGTAKRTAKVVRDV